MKFSKMKQSLSLVALALFAGSALAIDVIPSIPTDIPGVPGVNPSTPSVVPSSPGAPPAVPSTIPGTDSTTITFVKGTKGAPYWYSVRKAGNVRVSFKVQNGSTLVKDPKLVSKTVTAVDCNTGSPVASPSYKYEGTKVRFIRGSFDMLWKVPAKAIKGACVSLNLNAGASANVLAKVR